MSQFRWLPDEECPLKWLTSPEETQCMCQHAYWELRRESQTQHTHTSFQCTHYKKLTQIYTGVISLRNHL